MQVDRVCNTVVPDTPWNYLCNHKKIQLNTFRVQGLAFFYLGSPTIMDFHTNQYRYFYTRVLRVRIPQMHFVSFFVTVDLLICIFLNSRVSFFAFHYNFNKRIKHSFPYINVCQAKCDDVLQPEPRKTHYHTWAWQTLIYGKECYIVIVIYLPFKHKQFQKKFNCMQKCPQ